MNTFLQRLLLLGCLLMSGLSPRLFAEDGYRLWLRYDLIEDEKLRQSYAKLLTQVLVEGEGEVLGSAREELLQGLSGLLGRKIPSVTSAGKASGIVAGIWGQSALISALIQEKEIVEMGPEGYRLLARRYNESSQIVLVAKDERGLLYGAFALLRHLQQGLPLTGLDLTESPRVQLRVLNHWDNLDRTVERGYAGFSIWNFHELPDYLDPRYRDYARANASIGINGTVVTNVNANALIFRADYLEKFKALAGVFRPYGIQLYLTARFSSPIEQGGLSTADPLDPAVQKWWRDKATEIYAAIPDFGGFLVKANSEGQPGPQNYGRNHADGANMLADALAPHGGVVIWRAFVYSEEEPEDRAKQAYNEFVPLDGSFRDNVLVQVKNGPIDFQPREPIHPLFGAMPQTPVMMEFQITKEYLGQGTHLVGLSNMWEEVLKTDTQVNGPGSTVARVIDGSLHNYRLTGMSGVANIGTARNWTGNLFGQADWYAFGRLAWNPDLSSKTIHQEWIAQTFDLTAPQQLQVLDLLMGSHETCVRYMTPLGLHHIMGAGHHYGPGPWVSNMPRADWTSVYYHKADSQGIGFNRTPTGSNALEQYAPGFAAQYADAATCPPEFLLWFHHLPWDHAMPSGRNLWQEICFQYQLGVEGVLSMQQTWAGLKPFVDGERHNSVAMHLAIQANEAAWWRDACLRYFEHISGHAIPVEIPQPAHDLEHYRALSYPYSPGIRPDW